MTAFRLLQERQEALMSRVEPKERPAKREAQESRRQTDARIDRTSGKVEGDERTADEGPQDQDRRT